MAPLPDVCANTGVLELVAALTGDCLAVTRLCLTQQATCQASTAFLAPVEIAVDAHEQCMGYEADEARWEFEAEAAYEQWEREYYPHEFYSDSD